MVVIVVIISYNSYDSYSSYNSCSSHNSYGSNRSYDCTPFLHSLLTQGKLKCRALIEEPLPDQELWESVVEKAGGWGWV